MGLAAKLTPFQLIGLFNKTIGLTPQQFVRATRG
jgi:hypothetical protein